MANYKDTLLLSEDTIKTESYISDNLDSKFILSAIKNAQEINLPVVLYRAALYRKLQALVFSGEITSPKYEKYLELLDDYVQNYLISRTLANIFPLVNNKTSNFGTYQSSDDNIQPKTDIKAITEQYVHNADFYANAVQEFLILNKDSFEELNGVCLNAEKTSATTGLWLGGDRAKKVSTARPIENITINIEKSGEGYGEGYEDGYNQGKSDGENDGFSKGADAQKAKLSNLEVTKNGTYTRRNGYKQVTVNVEGGSSTDIINPSMDVTVPSNGINFTLGQLYSLGDNEAFGTDTMVNVAVEGGSSIDVQNPTIDVTVPTTGINFRLAQVYYMDDTIALGGDTVINVNVPQDGVTPEDKKIDHIYSDNASESGWALEVLEDGRLFLGNNANADVKVGYEGDVTKFQEDGVYFHIYLKDYDTSRVEITENGTTTIDPSLDRTEVVVNIPQDGGEGYEKGKTDGIAEQKAKLTSLEVNKSGIYTREDGYNQVTVAIATGDEGSIALDYPADFDFKKAFKRIDTKVYVSGDYSLYKLFDSMSNLTWISAIITSPLLNDTTYMFKDCSSLQTVPLFDTSRVSSAFGMFQRCTSLLTIPQFDTSNLANANQMFDGCTSLTSLPLLDATYLVNTSSMFRSCSALTDLGGFKNLSTDLSLSYSTALTVESLMNVINNLATVEETKTLTLGSTNLAKLTDGQKQVAIDKGWTLK